MAQEAVGKIGSVTGLDVNASMLLTARDLTAGSDIVWIERDVSETGLGAYSFVAVISQHGYHYFPDKSRALAELRRVLVPGGRLALSIWAGHCVYTSALCAAVEKYISPEIARKQSDQRETPSPEQLKAALTDAGFRDVDVCAQTLEIRVPLVQDFVPLHLSSMPIAVAYEALGVVQKQLLIDDVARALIGDVQDG